MNTQEKYPQFYRPCSAEVSELALSKLERKYKWGFKRKSRHRGNLAQLFYAYAGDLVGNVRRALTKTGHDDAELLAWDIFKHAERQNWPNKLEDAVAMKGHRKLMAEQARQQREAERDHRAEKIIKRREQIARMEKKAALLNTRIKKAHRSLNALVRAQDKHEASKARQTEEQTEDTRVVGEEVASEC